MKTFLTRTLPLLLCIVVGTVISWISIYAFWFAVWTFHTVPAARAADAVGAFILSPGRWIFNVLGGDQSTLFYDPISFSGTNGLIVGIILYCVFRALLSRHESRKPVARTAGETRPLESKVG